MPTFALYIGSEACRTKVGGKTSDF